VPAFVELPELEPPDEPPQPSGPVKRIDHNAERHRAKNIPFLDRRRIKSPKRNTEASVHFAPLRPCSTCAVALVVAIVRVLESGELLLTCACAGLREQVGGLVGVP
jgi:hypothetical protein